MVAMPMPLSIRLVQVSKAVSKFVAQDFPLVRGTYVYVVIATKPVLVSWSLTSLFSTITAISDTN